MFLLFCDRKQGIINIIQNGDFAFPCISLLLGEIPNI